MLKKWLLQSGNRSPDIVLMDIDMPGLSCFDAAQRVATISPETDFIFLSSFSYDRYIDMALQVKAKGYLTKDESFSTLVKAIRRVASGKTHFSPSVQSRIIADKDRIYLSAAVPKTRVSILSPREVEVLQYLASGQSKKRIAQLMHVSIKTVDTHAHRLMKKLDIHDRVDLTHFAIRENLIEV